MADVADHADAQLRRDDVVFALQAPTRMPTILPTVKNASHITEQAIKECFAKA